MNVILPGQEYEIQVAGQGMKVKALTGAEQEILAEHIDSAREAENSGKVSELMRAAKSCLVAAVGADQADKLWRETVNASMALEIATAVFLSSQLNEEQVKN